MRCESCGTQVAVYELFPRSYRLYIYLCKSCRKGFLAHHFDLNLEIYQMEEVEMKEDGELVFITGLKTEPRVFDFKVTKDIQSVIVANGDVALGELALETPLIFASYSDKASKRLCRLLGLTQGSSPAEVTERIFKKWERAK